VHGLTINGRFLAQRMTGVQRYAREIIAELDCLLGACPFGDGMAAKLIVPAGTRPDLTLRAISIKQTRFRGGPLWTQLVLPFVRQGVLLSLGSIGPVLASKQILDDAHKQRLPAANKLASSRPAMALN
jgi:hypothetical protein